MIRSTGSAEIDSVLWSNGGNHSKNRNTNFNFFNVLDGIKMKDGKRSNDFTYDEQVYAGYISPHRHRHQMDLKKVGGPALSSGKIKRAGYKSLF